MITVTGNPDTRHTAPLHAETMNTTERLARFANGLLVLTASLLMLVPALSIAGFWLTVAMGLSLVFSGVTGFCGWVRIFRLWR